jgi:hypothetical protein
MASHDVSFRIPQKFIWAKDVEFEIKSNGEKLGELLISKGNLEWVPRGNSANKFSLTWNKFAQLMEVEGKPTKIQKRKTPKKEE